MDRPHPSLEELDAYVISQLPEHAMQSVQQHVGKCRTCKYTAKHLRRHAEMLKQDLIDDETLTLWCEYAC